MFLGDCHGYLDEFFDFSVFASSGLLFEAVAFKISVCNVYD